MSETQPEILWFVQIADGKKSVPISWERLKNLAEQKKVLPDTKVRNNLPNAVWVPAETIPNLFENLEEVLPTQMTSSEITVVTKNTEEKTKPAEKKEPSVTSFTVNAGTEQTKTNIITNPVFKIDTKKSVPKENKEEKKSTGIFGLGTQKSKIETEKKKNEIEKTDASVKLSEPEKKKSDQSIPAIKISVSPPKEKDKNKEKSSVSETFVIDTEPTQEKSTPKEEPSQETFPESNESDNTVAETSELNVAETNLKKHEKKKDIQSSPKRKTGIIPLLLITLAVFSILIGGVGGIGVFLLGYYKQLAVFSATLGTIVFLFGVILGIVSWLLALFFNQSEL